MCAANLGAQADSAAILPLDYQFTIDLPDSGAAIHGDARITFLRRAPADSLTLDLIGLHVQRVDVDGNSAVKFRRTDSVVVIPIGAGTARRFTIRVVYDGTPTDGLIVSRDSAGRWTYFGDNWPTRARHWLPTIDRPDAKATVTWTVTAPIGQTIVANGALIDEHNVTQGQRQRVVSRWRERKRIAPYLMVIAAAPLVKMDLGESACGYTEIVSCVRQTVYAEPEQAKMLPGTFSHAGDIVDFFARTIGAFPYEKLAHLQSRTRFGGMENATAIFYADGFFHRNGVPEGIIAHETAHQWFGDGVTERAWPHVWLSEGFATYFAALYTQHAHGDSAFRAEMARIRADILNDTVAVPTRPVVDTAQTNLLELLNVNSYQKGGFVLHMLRTELGDSIFFRGIRDYYAAHKDMNALTDDLRRNLEYVSHRDLRGFFDQWLRRPGFAELAVSWTYDAQHGTVLNVRQVGRYGFFALTLPVVIVDSDGARRTMKIPVAATSETSAQISPRGTRVREVIIDPDVTVLMRLVQPAG